MQLYYRKTGKGVPLVILHGVFGSSDNWLTMGKLLSEQGFEVFMIDQRNHGQSPHAPLHDYSSMAADLLEFLEHHHLHQIYLIGHSMGGKTAMQFAISHPEKIKKMIVVDIAPKQYLIHHGKILRGLNAIPLATISSRQEADQILSQYEEDIYTRQFLLKNLYRNENNQFAWRINLPVLTEQIANVVAAIESDKNVNVDVLFMKGEKSWYITSEDEKAILKIFSKASFITIKGAGHWIHAEQPELFLKATLEFFKP
ncbi:MAG: alpha/beta fold hydrolase [Cytophagales bacterium]|nr:alpha/beta fold hydrolase [Cytophagales bacterium]MDW8384201.1 alpha/beta fold hydrolase [Flammeovirgaceae bacterium]